MELWPEDGLRGAGVDLRLFEEADVPFVHRALNDDGLVASADLPFTRPSVETVAAVVTDRLPGWLAERFAATVGIVDRTTGALVGGAALRRIQWEAGIGEVGYWLVPEGRGRGFATETCRLLTAHAFALGLHRVEAWTHVGNAASQAVLTRAGFVREGVLRSMPMQRGGRADVALYSRLPADPV